MFGSRARKLNVSAGIGSETAIVIGKMFGDIEVVTEIGVLRSWPSHHDATLTGAVRIGTAEIGNGPIAGGPIAIDPIAFGNPAHPARQCRAIERVTIKIGEIGDALSAVVRIVTDRIDVGSRTPLDRQSRTIEIATIATEKIRNARIVNAQRASRSRDRPIRKCRATETVRSGVEKSGSVLSVTLRIVSVQIEFDGPAPQDPKDGRTIKVRSESNAERGGRMTMMGKELPSGGKVQPRSKDSRHGVQAIPGTTDAGRMRNRSDLRAGTTRSLAPNGRRIESGPVQSRGGQSQDQNDLRGRKRGSTVAPRATDRNRSVRA